MNIDDRAKSIIEMPNDAQFYLLREFPSIGKTMQGYGNNGMITDLQAMARFWLMRAEILRELTSINADGEMLTVAGKIESLGE